MIAKDDIKDVCPLTPMQEGMLFHHLLDKASAAYFEQSAYRVHSELDYRLFEQAFVLLIERYDVLRTIFIHEKVKRPMQVVLKKRETAVYYEDISSLKEEEREHRLLDFKEADKKRGFDLQQDMLIRLSILKIKENEYEIVWSFHHIIMDGWCTNILVAEFLEIYRAILEHRNHRLPPVKPYRDYLRWLEKRDPQESRQYWATYLEGYEETAGLPRHSGQLSQSGSTPRRYKSERHFFVLDEPVTKQLTAQAARHNATLNHLIQAAWGILLARCSNKEDVVFGAVVSGRPAEIDGVETMVGLFINTIPVRVITPGRLPFDRLLCRLRDDAVNSEPHHYYSLAEIQSGSRLKRDLLDHILVFENYPEAAKIEGLGSGPGREPAGKPFKPFKPFKIVKSEGFEQTNYHFNIIAYNFGRLTVRFNYNGNMYDPALIHRAAGHFEHLLRQLAVDAGKEIREYDLLTADEQAQIRFEFNAADSGRSRSGKEDRENLEKQEISWLQQFSGEIPVLELPYDYPRPESREIAADTIQFEIEDEPVSRMERVAAGREATLFMFLIGSYNVLLARLSGQQEIITGVPAACCQHQDVQDVTGLFENILVLRTYPQGEKPFAAFLAEVKEQSLQVFANPAVRFADMLAKLEVNRDRPGSGLFNVMFAMQPRAGLATHQPESAEDPGDPRESIFGGSWIGRTAGVDLILRAVQVGKRLCFALEYSTGLFKRETMERWVTYFQEIISQVSRQPQLALKDIDFIPAGEKEHLLFALNDTQADYPQTALIHELFAGQVEQAPDRIALAGPGWSSQQTGFPAPMCWLTYRELARQAGQKAAILVQKGIRPGDIAALKTGRNLGMIAALLGILQAGAAYLPMDTGFPPERIDFMLKDSAAKVLFNGDAIQNIQNTQCRHHSQALCCSAQSLAYIIYTSGTTGKPKGCCITHRNVVRLMKNDRLQFDFSAADIWVMAHSYCFDFSVWEMYGALLYGARLILPPVEEVRDITGFHALVGRYGVTILNQTPQAFYAFARIEQNQPRHLLDRHLRYVIFGGDKLLPGNLQHWITLYPPEKIALINMFGITETTVHVTFYRLSGDDIREASGLSPIGGPIPETTLYLLDQYGKLVPGGVTGEIVVGGTGVSAGYLNRPELTAEKFVSPCHILSVPAAGPFDRSSRLYRSGDLGRLSNGDDENREHREHSAEVESSTRVDKRGRVEYLGRCDEQVQIRGYRVEPAEIETRLLSFKGIKEAVVVAREDTGMQAGLCAYIVLRDASATCDSSALKEYVSAALPPYMVPATFVTIDSIPLTANGKLDRKRLPVPVITRSEAVTAPTNKLETTVAGAWQEVLGIEQIGIDDNFFDLGGNSINAIRLYSKLNTVLDKPISIVEIFEYVTVRSFVQHVQQEQEEAAAATAASAAEQSKDSAAGQATGSEREQAGREARAQRRERRMGRN